jgi:translation initiation factor 1
MARKKHSGTLVYSTDNGRICPKCGLVKSVCHCSKTAASPTGDGIVRVGRETKGRKGKGVTTITGIPLAADELKAYAAQLKKKCGTGGAIKQGVVEIQGDHRDSLMVELQKQGWTVKRSGG